MRAPHHAITGFTCHSHGEDVSVNLMRQDAYAKKDAKKLSDLIAVAVSTEHVITHMGV